MKVNFKFKCLMLVPALVAGLSSCNNDDDGISGNTPIVDEGTPTNVRIAINQFRDATYADPNDANATVDEAELKTVDVFIYNASGTLVVHENLDDNDFLGPNATSTTGENAYTGDVVIKTTTGEKTVLVGVNLPGTMVSAIVNNATIGGVATAYNLAAVSEIASNTNGFSMFSTDKVTKTLVETNETVAANIPTSNQFSVVVARMTAKIAVFEATGLNYDVAGGTLSDIEFTVLNNNKKIFPMQQKDGVTIIDPNWADGSYVSSDFDNTSAYVTTYRPINKAGFNDIDAMAVKYAPENTTQKYYQKETTYASIRAGFIPTSIKVYDNGTDNTDGYADNASGLSTPQTFYLVSLTNGTRAYFLDAAVAASYAADNGLTAANIVTYEDGYCYYNMYLNPTGRNAGVASPTNKFGVLRNTFYKANITEILGIGSPDPEPVDPEIPVEENTNIRVDIIIQPWQVEEEDFVLSF